MKIVNLTQHPATPEQLFSGVMHLPVDAHEFLQEALTFDAIPYPEEIKTRARVIAALAGTHGFRKAMIGGAPFLMAPLERALRQRGIVPVYAFIRRETVEETQPDGTVRKVSKFKHLGFVEGISNE